MPTASSSLCSLFSFFSQAIHHGAFKSSCVSLFRKQKSLQLELSENPETHPQLGLVAKENETESYPILDPLEMLSSKAGTERAQAAWRRGTLGAVSRSHQCAWNHLPQMMRLLR